MHKLKKSLLILSLFALTLAFLSNHSAYSQTVFFGKLTGTITDDTGEFLPGVTVEATGEALITGARSTVTSGKGVYVFLNLPVGRYTIKATLEGFKSVIQEDVIISAGVAITIDLIMEPGAIEEQITVIGASPVVDSKSSTIATNIMDEMLDKLPTGRDAFYDLSLTTPGMAPQGKDSSWLPSPTAYGSQSNENVFLINGVNTTNPRLAAAGSLVKVNYNAIEEVRVIALGSKAEYGNFTGVAIDVLTKSGSNEFHGNIALYTILGKAAVNQPGRDEFDTLPTTETDIGSWGEERLFIPAGDDIIRYQEQEYEGNFTLGGPIIKDKVWFYAGADYIKSETKTPFWPVLDRSWGRFGDIKITAEPLTNHRAWVAYHYENNDGDGWTWHPHWDATMTYGQGAITHAISSQWQWLATGKTILTAKYMGFWRDDQPFIPDDAPDNPGYINWWKWNVVGVNGNFPYVEAQKSSRHTVQADVSHYAEDFLGEHDIKFGAQYTIGRGNWLGGYFQGYANFAYPAPWTQNINYMKSWYGATGLVMYNRQTWLNPFLTVRTSDNLGLFIDDQWSPTKRLTFNIGLRYDRMTAKYGEGKVYENPSTPEGINDPPPVIRDREGTDNVFDLTTFAPRIGITYALTSDMKTVFRANYGRYFMPLNTEYLRRFGPDMPEAEYHWIYYNIPFELVDLNGNNYVDPGEVDEATRYLYGDQYRDDSLRPSWLPAIEPVDYSWRLYVADDLKAQYTDQITVNLERELFADFSASLTYIYKHTSNILVQWPLNRETGQEFQYERVAFETDYGEQVDLWGIPWIDYNGDGVVDGGDIGWIGTHTDREVRNMPDIDGKKPRRIFHGVQLTLKKRFSNRWQMLASLLWSDSDGMAARSIRQDFNVEGPMIFDTNWLSGMNQTINTMEGPLPHTPVWEFKLSGSYRVPYVEADIGLRLRYNSGRPLWPLQVIPTSSQWSQPPGGVITTGGSHIVAIDPNDPWYLPSETVVDLRLDKGFALGDYGVIRAALDVLNVFNEDAVTNAGYGGAHEPVLGRVSGLTFPSRKIRLSLSFQF
ncbi:MAG: TonB-dependent receptor [Candidatus Aminicenantes bacterium]|nr:TonB-dependent receptor [Candidatus Aminicenantes bacterium]